MDELDVAYERAKELLEEYVKFVDEHGTEMGSIDVPIRLLTGESAEVLAWLQSAAVKVEDGPAMRDFQLFILGAWMGMRKERAGKSVTIGTDLQGR